MKMYWEFWLKMFIYFDFLVLVRSEAKDIHNSDSPPKEWKVLSVLFAMYLHRQLQRVFATWTTFWGSIRNHTIYIIHDYYSEKRMHRILNRKLFIVSFHQFINCWIHKQSKKFVSFNSNIIYCKTCGYLICKRTNLHMTHKKLT